MAKDQKGFTLVETIVIAVIVALLAAVALPLYYGYVHDSRLSVANNTAGTVASFCGAIKQQNVANVPNHKFGEGEILTVPGEGGVPNNIRIPLGYEVTITGGQSANTTGNVICNSLKDASVYSEPFYF